MSILIITHSDDNDSVARVAEAIARKGDPVLTDRAETASERRRERLRCPEPFPELSQPITGFQLIFALGKRPLHAWKHLCPGEVD